MNDAVTPPEPPVPFSPLAFLGGLILSLLVGAIANVFAVLAGAGIHIGFLTGLIPGGIFIAISRVMRKSGFAQGLLIGGCIIAVIGGLCGASVGDMNFG